jgi:hypothetical protein
MPNRSSKVGQTPAAKRGVGNRTGKHGKGNIQPDLNATAFSIVQQATGEIPKQEPPAKPKKNPAAVTLGRLGGLVGGKARAAKLTAEQRAEIARNAAEKRWRTPPEESR